MSDTHLTQLDDALIQDRLVASGLFARVRCVGSTGSTNDDLLDAVSEREAGQPWPHLSVITAEQQTGGRGRQARAWSSPAGSSLSTSVLLRPNLPPEKRHWLTLCLGAALVRALRTRKIPAGLKWPNDVHVQGRKIAGILAVVPPQDQNALVVGCGINVLLTAQQLPTPTATSVILELERAAQHPPAVSSGAAAELRSTLLCDWLEEAADLLRRVDEHGVDAVREEMLCALSTVGQEVRVELPDGTAVRGTAVGVEHDGALTVEVSSRRRAALDPEAGGGAEHLWTAEPAPRRETFHAGDVVHLRAVGGPA